MTNFRPTNLILLLSIQILCASHFKSVKKYAPPAWIQKFEFQIFSFILHHKVSTQTIFVNKKSQYQPFRNVQSDFKFVHFFIHPVQ